MKKDITEFLNTHAPTLTEGERASLWNSIESSLTPQPVASPYTLWVRTHVRLTAGVLILVLLVTGGATSAFAGEARPGDTLFPLDRAIERIELALARTPETRTNVGLQHAEERLLELRELIRETPSTTVTASSSNTHAHVGAAVHALVNVLEESQMSETARERVYEHLFTEIDSLSVDVKVEQRSPNASHNRVSVDSDDTGKTKIEIKESEKRTRIEKKNGRVSIEYDLPGEVEGARSDESKDRGRNR